MDDADIYTPGTLPVIMAFTEELGIVEVFNEHLDWNESQCTVSPGHRLLAILANLLTEGKPNSPSRTSNNSVTSYDHRAVPLFNTAHKAGFYQLLLTAKSAVSAIGLTVLVEGSRRDRYTRVAVGDDATASGSVATTEPGYLGRTVTARSGRQADGSWEPSAGQPGPSTQLALPCR